MAKKNNVTEEIQELIQQIKNEYQEGVDFAFAAPKLINRASGGFHVKILSPKLKKVCREKFNLLCGVNIELDYEKGDQEGNDFYYRLEGNSAEYDILDCVKGELYRFNHDKQKPKKCKVCGELTSYEEGQIAEWNKANTPPETKIIGYLHPECLKKYFAEKKQPSENNARIKEKLLRNLDKICIGPSAYLENAEYLKNDGAESDYWKLHESNYTEWENRFLRIVIDGEEINLENFDCASKEFFEVKSELVKELIKEIKKNPQEWKIVEPSNKENSGNNWVVRHQSGRQHWNLGICMLRGRKSLEVGKRDWTEIWELIKGSSLPIDNQESDTNEIEWIKSYFQKYNIKKISFKNGELVITNNNNNNNNKIITKDQLTNNFEYQLIKNSLSSLGKNELTSQELGINSKNTSNNTDNSSSGNKYLWLVGGISVGIIISAILVFSLRRKKKKIN